MGSRAANGVVGPEPSFIPEGMRLHESGNAGGVADSSWSDGRAWFKVASTPAWRGRRLFGDMGDPVRRMATDIRMGLPERGRVEGCDPR